MNPMLVKLEKFTFFPRFLSTIELMLGQVVQSDVENGAVRARRVNCG